MSLFEQSDKKAIPIFIIIIAFNIAIYTYPIMPEKMASHWSYKGDVNGYMSKNWSLFLMPGLSVGLYLLFLLIPRIDPLRKNINKFSSYFDNFVIIILTFLLYLYLVTIFWNLGFQFNIKYIIIPPLSILFYYIGILMEKAKRNWFIGIRTPWTLSNDRVWRKTHLIGGKIFKAYAVFIFLSIIFVYFIPEYAILIVIIPIFIIVFILVAISYIEYQKNK